MIKGIIDSNKGNVKLELIGTDANVATDVAVLIDVVYGIFLKRGMEDEANAFKKTIIEGVEHGALFVKEDIEDFLDMEEVSVKDEITKLDPTKALLKMLLG